MKVTTHYQLEEEDGSIAFLHQAYIRIRTFDPLFQDESGNTILYTKDKPAEIRAMNNLFHDNQFTSETFNLICNHIIMVAELAIKGREEGSFQPPEDRIQAANNALIAVSIFCEMVLPYFQQKTLAQ